LDRLRPPSWRPSHSSSSVFPAKAASGLSSLRRRPSWSPTPQRGGVRPPELAAAFRQLLALSGRQPPWARCPLVTQSEHCDHAQNRAAFISKPCSLSSWPCPLRLRSGCNACRAASRASIGRAWSWRGRRKHAKARGAV